MISESRWHELPGVVARCYDVNGIDCRDVAKFFGCSAEDIKDLLATVRELQAKQRWIPVSEQLPSDSENVIICTKDGSVYYDVMFINKFSDDLARFYDESTDTIFRLTGDYAVTHWMPLPELPESNS